jgi:hypothetical protein
MELNCGSSCEIGVNLARVNFFWLVTFARSLQQPLRNLSSDQQGFQALVRCEYELIYRLSLRCRMIARNACKHCGPRVLNSRSASRPYLTLASVIGNDLFNRDTGVFLAPDANVIGYRVTSRSWTTADVASMRQVMCVITDFRRYSSVAS